MLKLFNMNRLVILTAIVLSLFLSLPISAHAEAFTLLRDKQNAIKEGGNQEGWLSESFASNAVVGLQTLTGPIPDAVLNGTATVYIPEGIVGYTSNMIAALYTPPASGIQYLASLKDGFLGKPAYAQNGGGFAGLQPILPIWRGFRNIVYLLSSLVFIIIGVMIMLRVKISPQAVITVQNAVPQLITTLILVTFSYAIAGLLIDLMSFFQGFVIALLFEVTGKGLQTNLLPGIKSYSFDTLTNAGIGTFADLTMRALPVSVFLGWGAILGAIIGGFFFVGTGGLSMLAIGIVPVIVLLVIMVLVVIWMFKFYFGCLKAYVTVIFKIVIAPLELAMGAFPNSKMGFSSWIWDIIANLAIFPVSLIFLVIGNMIIDESKKGMWAPSVISNLSIPTALVGLGTLGLNNIISVGIGLSVVALMSKLPDMIPEFIFSIKPSPWGKAIGESFTMGKTGQLIGAGANQGVHDLMQKGSEKAWDSRLTGALKLGAQAMELTGRAKSK
ncbi:MAG: hypothetical protein WC851_05185 [Candidatus Shapirobacteria bacterium]|jgi:hypothetical protein